MDHVSFSQLNMYLRCGEQYRRRYVQGEILPPSAALVRGKCGHKALQHNYTQKIQTLGDLPIDEVVDVFADTWEQEKYTISWTKDVLDGIPISQAYGVWKDKGIAMTREYQTIIAPNIFPASVEEKMEVEFEGGYPKLVSIIDRIDRTIANNDQPNKFILSEVKFVSRSPKAGDADTDVQLTCYDYVYRQRAKVPPLMLSKEYAVGTKEPKALTQTCPPREKDRLDRFLERLLRTMQGIAAGIFPPAQNGSWSCDPRYCGYYHSCKVRP